MKSSRSSSSKNTRRNARKFISDSSDDSENERSSSSIQMDSARAEKLFSRRRLQEPMSNTLKNQPNHIEANKTLFRVSDSDESEMSSQDINQSINKPKSHDFLKYRNRLLSSDDEDSKSTNQDNLNDSCISKKNSALLHSDDSAEEYLQEEYLDDKSIQSTSGYSIDNDSILKLPKMRRNRPRILDSSDESDVATGHNTINNSVINETKIVLESESDEDIINSSKELYPTPMKANHENCRIDIKLKKLPSIESSDSDNNVSDHYKSNIASSNQNQSFSDNSKELNSTPMKSNNENCQIDIKLKELSLIESSDFDNNMSDHYKSNIASSNQNRSFSDDLKISNTTLFSHKPLCQSSILENSSNVQNHNESIELINLDDENPIIFKESSLKQSRPIVIDLTENNTSSVSSTILLDDNSSKSLKKFTNSEANSLRMEKKRLEEIIGQFTKNIDTMKNTMKVTNLHLLPDGGLKLKQAIKREENALKDTTTQLKNILEKLNNFPEEFSNHIKEPTLPPPLGPLKSLNSDNALLKKAAANIDIQAMGDKALSTYRTQQTMTLDVLQSIHQSLKTCPSTDTLADDPSGLKVKLMDHQKYALNWLLWREKQKPHGGILADDMGLGKTLTMISLILKATDAENKPKHLDKDDSNHREIKGGTLIICPSSLMSQWINEIKTKLSPRLLDVVQHYGPNRESSPRRLSRKDIVITTYHIVMWDQKNHPNTSPLFQIKWKRIILDEAHTIRNPKSQTSIAVCALSSVNYWALSGTPIHNKEADFYALLKFIKCHPFDEWAVWKRWVENNDEAGKNRLSLLVKALMLRRTKAELSERTTFQLPLKTVHTVKVELFEKEKEAYEKVLLFSRTLFAKYLYEKAEKQNAVEKGFPIQNKAKYFHQKNMDDHVFKDLPELDKLFRQLKNNSNIQAHHILVLILRLRQLCCHPCLMKNMLDSDNLKVDGIPDTAIDLELVDNMSRMSIGIPSVENKPLSNSNEIFNDSWISSKIKAVCDMVKEKVLHTNDKAIIVSQWPSMLNLIDKQLSQYHLKTEMFSGAVPILLRNKLVNEFNNVKDGPKILLLSLTAGGVGLNLVAANHMFLVDIHWNPQLEAQACDRIYRVGQTKPVNVYKFICSDTIESTIQSIQSHKLEIANNLFGGCSSVEGGKITLDDLKHIFNINPKFKQ